MNERLLLAALLLTLACAHAPEPRRDDATASLVAAERAFARAASTRLVNDAFLAVLAEDATLFTPAPANGRSALARDPMPASLDLRWTPIYAETASDGLLGFTTGPSQLGQRGHAPVGTGFFVSVWRRIENDWELVLDGGVRGPIPVPVDSAPRLLHTRASLQAFSGTADLRSVENTLIANYAARFETLADHDVRVYREGSLPSASLAEGVALVKRTTIEHWAPSDVVVASSRDLGYVYGVTNPNSDAPRGYLRIYRRAADGAWKIAVDWTNQKVNAI